MAQYKPILGITMGDPAGIGPEIAVKALSNKKVYEICRPMVVGDAAVLDEALGLARVDLGLRTISEVPQAEFTFGTADVFDLKNVDRTLLQHGHISAGAGRASFEAIRKVIELALEGKIDATVTGPIHKESIHKGGCPFSGHTEIYAHYTGSKNYAMLLVHDHLRVIHVSTHVPLRRACDLVKKERIVSVIHLLDTACRQFGVREPRIGVAGLNPHASDGGLFGSEEELEIRPAVEQALADGLQVDGPVPPDTLFPKAMAGSYQGCVVMYHDQGHIPFKLAGFTWNKEKGRMESVRGVNITLGLPIIRTSVDHGTAFEIAGQGVASPHALLSAIEYAVKMALAHRGS